MIRFPRMRRITSGLGCFSGMDCVYGSGCDAGVGFLSMYVPLKDTVINVLSNFTDGAKGITEFLEEIGVL